MSIRTERTGGGALVASTIAMLEQKTNITLPPPPRRFPRSTFLPKSELHETKSINSSSQSSRVTTKSPTILESHHRTSTSPDVLPKNSSARTQFSCTIIDTVPKTPRSPKTPDEPRKSQEDQTIFLYVDENDLRPGKCKQKIYFLFEKFKDMYRCFI